MQEFTEFNLGFIACWRAASLMLSIIESLKVKQSFFGCWTAAERHDGFGSLSNKRTPAHKNKLLTYLRVAGLKLG